MNKQLLIIYSPALGDTICATPTLRKLSETYDQKISVVTYIPDVFYQNPYVDKIYNMEEYKNHDGFNLSQFNSYDIHTTFDSIGKKYDKIEKKHNIFDIRQFHATDLGFMLTPEEMVCEFYPTEKLEFTLPNKYVCLHSTTTWPSRTWSKENWIELMRMLDKNEIEFVLVGKDDSEDGFFHIDKKVYKFDNIMGLNLLNKTSLSQTWHIINNADCFITMDSGLLHLAGTTNTNIIQLGSSINPKFRVPYRKDEHGNISQNFRYKYILGKCDLHCASDMKYGIKEWNSIQGVPPLINCLENKPTFECHPNPLHVFNQIKEHATKQLDSELTDILNETSKKVSKTKSIKTKFEKKKKILYIAPHLSTGGMPKYLERCMELVKNEYDLYLIEYSFYSSEFIIQRNKILEMIDEDKFWSFGMDFGTFNRGIKSEVIDIIKEIKPDVIHLQEVPEFFMQYQTADFIYNSDRKWIIIETTHTTTIDLNTKRYFPDKFAHIGNYIAIQYKNKFPNIPYDIIEYEPGIKSEDVKVLNLNKKYKHILNVGIFTPNKGQDYIFKLAEYLQNYKIQFHFIGNQANNFKDYWEPLLKNKPHNCEIHGEKSNVDEWYASCDLFLFPSKLENNPIVLKEAIGWNMPILYKNLEVYDEKSDIKKYDNAIMLTENIKTDAKLILKILGLK